MITLAPAQFVKGPNAFPEFSSVLRDLESSSIALAQEIWQGYTLGGLTPTKKQFGIAPFWPSELTAAGTYTFRKNFAGTGWKPIFSYNVPEDEIHAFLGFAVTDSSLNITGLRLEIGDHKYPKWDIEEAKGWGSDEGGVAIIIKQNKGDELIAREETAVLLRGYVEATGYQRVVPLGLMIYKRTDLLIAE